MNVRTAVEKVAYHSDRVKAYLAGEQIFPVAVDIDLTNRCGLRCAGCYTDSRQWREQVEFDNVIRLFRSLEGKTKGLYLSGGGEPIIYKRLGDVLQAARDHGFEEIFVISGGLGIQKPRIQKALVKYATGVRVSLNSPYPSVYKQLYGVDSFGVVTEGIKTLVQRRNEAGSNLEIGIGGLTGAIMAPGIPNLVAFAENELCVDWVQFRPNILFDNGTSRVEHNDFIDRQLAIVEAQERGIRIIRSSRRYTTTKEDVSFDKYHAAHFMLTVAVDGTSWIGTECKEDRRFSAGNVYAHESFEDFLLSEERQRGIETSSNGYPHIDAMTRCILTSSFIQELVNGRPVPKINGVEHAFLV